MTQSSDARRNSLLYFKRVPEGFVFRAPNPWIFGPADHYLVSETQRDAIAAILLPQRPRHAAAKLVAFALALSAGLIGMIFLLSDYIAAAGGAWLFAGTMLATTLLCSGRSASPPAAACADWPRSSPPPRAPSSGSPTPSFSNLPETGRRSSNPG